MPSTGRFTVTLPTELIASIDRCERDRSHFIVEAVEHELARRREGLLCSIENSHPEAGELADVGLAEWAATLPQHDDGLVDVRAGTAVRWVEGQGWMEENA